MGDARQSHRQDALLAAALQAEIGVLRLLQDEYRRSVLTLIAVASMRGSDRREGWLSMTGQGGTLTVTESSSCSRTARLSKS